MAFLLLKKKIFLLTRVVLFFNIQPLLVVKQPISMHRAIELNESIILVPRRARALQQHVLFMPHGLH